MNPIDGVPLALFVTFMDVWATGQFGVPLWRDWGADPFWRVGLLLMAGGFSATLCHAWAQILKIRRFQQSQLLFTPPAVEVADV